MPKIYDIVGECTIDRQKEIIESKSPRDCYMLALRVKDPDVDIKTILQIVIDSKDAGVCGSFSRNITHPDVDTSTRSTEDSENVTSFCKLQGPLKRPVDPPRTLFVLLWWNLREQKSIVVSMSREGAL